MAPPFLVDLFVFDIAGTTVRDDGMVHRAFRVVADRHRLSMSDEWIKARMGWNKVHVFAEALRLSARDESGAPALADEFTNAILADMDARPPEPLRGAAESMLGLTAAGVRTAFNTGYSASLAEEIIRRVGWKPDAIIGSDLVPHGRPAPDMIRLAMSRTGVADPSRVGVAGDTPSDIAAGRAAGCRFVVGVTHGTFGAEDLATAGATHVLPDLLGLMEVLRGSR
ncbi:MAG: HAD hydrolase-like protein [Phycisphaeraceae bacterium]|nr:MAG: HAD hydrolase-like protein [Phycisphaeraceae bacterium]